MNGSLARAALLALAPLAGIATAQKDDQASSAQVVGTLRVHVPDTPRFVVHGTLPITPRPYRREACPLVVLDPDGNPLNTQWELVARLRNMHVVELRAATENRWSGVQTFQVVEGTNVYHHDDFDPEALEMIALRGRIGLQIERQNGRKARSSLSGTAPRVRFHRLGPATVTMQKNYWSPFGGAQAWLTLDAFEEEIDVVLNWHNGGLPAMPDVYFRSLKVLLPEGWSWTPVLPDPATGAGYLVRPDNHVLPQRMERSFRFVVHRTGATPDLEEAGWGVGDWSEGGYMAQSFALPDLGHFGINLTTEKDDRYRRLSRNEATVPGASPVSPLWPARGVQYGGMTGGIDVEQIPAVPLAVTGQVDGLLTLYVEQLRYASRHMGCIYAFRGDPVELDAHLRPDGTAPWLLFNKRFHERGGVPQDEPFFFSRTGPGNGFASYDPLVFDPIDDQHWVRRAKANKALAWLANDPLARLYLTMDAELARMTHYEGPGGRLKVPTSPGLGTEMGRGEAWMGDLMATAFALGDDAWRARTIEWFRAYAGALKTAQMPSGLFSATMEGKIAENPPYGNGQVARFYVHRSNEQVYLMLALRGVHRTTGIPTLNALRRGGEGLWNLAWKTGTSGPLERYPAGPLLGPRYTTRFEVPPMLTGSVAHDCFQVGTALGMAHEAGADMVPAILAYTGAVALPQARDTLHNWRMDNIANRANLLALLQKTVP